MMIVNRLGNNDTMESPVEQDGKGLPGSKSETKWLFTEREDVATLYHQQATRDSASEQESKSIIKILFFPIFLLA